MEDYIYSGSSKVLDVLENFIGLKNTKPIDVYLKKSPILMENYQHLCKLFMLSEMTLPDIQKRYQEIKDSKGYLIVFGEVFSGKTSRETSFQLTDYKVACLEQCYWILVDCFDRMPMEEFADNYKDFEENYIKNHMDCSPIQYRIYSLVDMSSVKIDIHRAYSLFLEEIQNNS